MQKWIYLTVSHTLDGKWAPSGDLELADLQGDNRILDEMLSRCGSRGWELVAVQHNPGTGTVYIFKRPAPAYP
jgi:hypothetical protein